MNLGDKFKNQAQKARGKVKERFGGATGDSKLKADGTADQAEGGVRQAGERAKDTGRDLKDSFTSEGKDKGDKGQGIGR